MYSFDAKDDIPLGERNLGSDGIDVFKINGVDCWHMEECQTCRHP